MGNDVRGNLNIEEQIKWLEANRRTDYNEPFIEVKIIYLRKGYSRIIDRTFDVKLSAFKPIGYPADITHAE